MRSDVLRILALNLCLLSSARALANCWCEESPTFSRPNLPQVVIADVIAEVDSTSWLLDVLAAWSVDTPETLLVSTYPAPPEPWCISRVQRLLEPGKRYLLATTEEDSIGHCTPGAEFDPMASAFHRLGDPVRIRTSFDWRRPSIDDTIELLRDPDPRVASKYLWDLPTELVQRSPLLDVIIEVGAVNDATNIGGRRWLDYALHADPTHPALLDQVRNGRGTVDYWSSLLQTTGLATTTGWGSRDREYLDFDVRSPELLEVLAERFDFDSNMDDAGLRFLLQLPRVTSKGEMRSLLVDGSRNPSGQIRALVPMLAVRGRVGVDDYALVEILADYALEPTHRFGQNYWFHARPSAEEAVASGRLTESRLCALCDELAQFFGSPDCGGLLAKLGFSCSGSSDDGRY